MLMTLGAACRAEGSPQDDEDRERRVRDRFLEILERTPRRGTAFDRVYGYHVERGTLDAFAKTYQDRVAKDPNDGTAWLLIGLIESQRGRDAAAVAAFREAERHRPDDALASFYLGQALVLVGPACRRGRGFERALQHHPARADLWEIFQALARVHHRAGRDDRALAVWARLEQTFPGDPRVQEQIASALAEEGRFEPALARYEALAGAARDPYRKVRFRIEAADLKLRLGRRAEALRDFEQLLAAVNPGSWLERELRRRIEDVFLRNDDPAGLITYYEKWIEKAPEDVEAMARLGRTLAGQGRAAEARVWLDRALARAPSRKELRLALIDQLVQERKFAEAAAQYETLSRSDPNNPDLIRDWGRLLLRDTSRPEAERKRAAVAVWRRLVEAKPTDASTAVQVADWMRQAELTDEALALYQKAVALAPSAPRYREYLGEYYHALKRTEEALAAWRSIADGPNHNVQNVARMGEVLAEFGYKSEALAAFAEACALDPEAFDLRLKHAALLHEAKRYDEADAQLAIAERLASSAEEREDVLARRISNDEAAGTLPERLASLRREVEGAKAQDADAWLRLGRYAEAARQPIEAIAAMEKALALDPAAIPAWVTAARLYEAAGRFAAAAYRKLAVLDRRARTEHLTSLARIEVQLGRHDEALQAGRDLLAAALANPEHAQFFADLCFQLGADQEGLEALRRAERANESDPTALTNLAEALAREFRTEEAIEMFWRAFDGSKDLGTKLGVVTQLADLYLQRNQFDRLLARLKRLGGEEGRSREAMLCLAQAHAAAGDFGAARQLLEGLLADNNRDTTLLKQLGDLAESEGDYVEATKYLKQLFDIAPNEHLAFHLSQVALQAGEIEVAEAVWSRSTGEGQDLSRVLQALDTLLVHGRNELVLATTTRLLRKHPGNWEILFREGCALWALERFDDAARRFQELLDHPHDDDEVSVLVKARRKALAFAGARRASTVTVSLLLRIERTSMLYRVADPLYARALFGLEHGLPLSRLGPLATPTDYGRARMGALTALFAKAQRDKAETAWLAKLRQAHEQAPNDPRPLWNEFYLGLVRYELRDAYEAAKALVRLGGHNPSIDSAYLFAMMNRNSPPGSPTLRTQSAMDDFEETAPPLPPDEIDLIRDAFIALARSDPALLSYSGTAEGALAELKRAGRASDIDALYQDLLTKDRDIGSIALACSIAAQRGDLDGLRKLNNAFNQLPARMRTTHSPSVYYILAPQGTVLISPYYMARALAVKAEAKAYAEILKFLDDYLASARAPAHEAQRARSLRTPSPLLVATNRYPIFLYPIFLSKTESSVALDYPTPGPYLDFGTILLLRNAFAIFQRDDLLSDLLAHARQSAEAAANDPVAALYAHLELSALLWWADEKDEAIRELAKAVALAPKDADLKLTLAELWAQRREPDEALAVADTVEAVDQNITKRRELLALRMAVQINRVERARQAAERLFGLRLDSAVEVQLAAQMHQLGLHELADAVLARAHRRAGNNAEALVSLMNQYQKQGKIDTAVQIAHEILRRTQGSFSNRAVNIDEPAQRQAIQVLARSGKLQEMTERIETQLRLSPRSIHLHQLLAAYYRAANQRDKLRAITEAMVQLRPDGAPLRLDVANQLMRSGAFLLDSGHLADAVRIFRTVLAATDDLALVQTIPVLPGQTFPGGPPDSLLPRGSTGCCMA